MDRSLKYALMFVLFLCGFSVDLRKPPDLSGVASKVGKDSELRNHPAILWYPRMDRPISDIYARYCLVIEPDVVDGMNELGVKLPGLEGSGFSIRMEHGKHIQGSDPPQLPLLTYWYLADPFMKDRSGYGLAWHMGVNFTVGTVHCIEQHLRLNTRKEDGTFNRDGVIEIWFDGRKVYENSAVLVQDKVWPAEINNFFGNFYHGGSRTPKKRMHYQFGGIAISQQYIGPLRKLVRE